MLAILPGLVLVRCGDDFMFLLTEEEFLFLRSQNASTKFSKTRTLPFAFIRNRIAILSSVLNSDDAIQVNIRIMRIFSHAWWPFGTFASDKAD